MQWERAVDRDTLAAKERVVFRHGPKQIALLEAGDEVFAFDNRCPHQGFPLKVGTLAEGCLLTCNWHNWKFDLRSGQCTTGGDNVRTYPTKVEAGAVWVDVADPGPEEVAAQVLADLQVALEKRQFGRLSRELTRLHLHGLDVPEAFRRAITWSHDRLEWGTSHAYAAAADWLTLADERPEGDDEGRLACWSEALDHVAFDALRQPAFPFPEGEAAWDPAAFVAAIEAEDEAGAIARLRGARAAGRGWADLEEAFFEAALAHYSSFGHSVIYVDKTRELIGRLGDAVTTPLALALTRHLVYATREDLIPEFQAYGPRLAAWGAPLGEDRTALDGGALAGLGVNASMDWVVAEGARAHPEALFGALFEANAANLLRFDEGYHHAFDRPTKDHVGWLDFTHALTMADAVGQACARYPRLWKPALLQLACFQGRNHGYLDDAVRIEDWAVEDPEGFFPATAERLLDHGQGLPIYSAHLVKTTVAVRQRLGELRPEAQAVALAGLNRFLQAPLKQKHVRRQVRESLALVSRDFA